MAAKLKINQLSADLADRARNAFAGVVTDLDELLTTLSEKLGSGPMPRREELLKAIRAVRKSLNARLDTLESAVQGNARKATRKRASKVAKKVAKTAKKGVKKASKRAKAVKPKVRKAAKVAKKTTRKVAKKATRKVAGKRASKRRGR